MAARAADEARDIVAGLASPTHVHNMAVAMSIRPRLTSLAVRSAADPIPRRREDAHYAPRTNAASMSRREQPETLSLTHTQTAPPPPSTRLPRPKSPMSSLRSSLLPTAAQRAQKAAERAAERDAERRAEEREAAKVERDRRGVAEIRPEIWTGRVRPQRRSARRCCLQGLSATRVVGSSSASSSSASKKSGGKRRRPKR